MLGHLTQRSGLWDLTTHRVYRVPDNEVVEAGAALKPQIIPAMMSAAQIAAASAKALYAAFHSIFTQFGSVSPLGQYITTERNHPSATDWAAVINAWPNVYAQVRATGDAAHIAAAQKADQYIRGLGATTDPVFMDGVLQQLLFAYPGQVSAGMENDMRGSEAGYWAGDDAERAGMMALGDMSAMLRALVESASNNGRPTAMSDWTSLQNKWAVAGPFLKELGNPYTAKQAHAVAALLQSGKGSGDPGAVMELARQLDRLRDMLDDSGYSSAGIVISRPGAPISRPASWIAMSMAPGGSFVQRFNPAMSQLPGQPPPVAIAPSPYAPAPVSMQPYSPAYGVPPTGPTPPPGFPGSPYGGSPYGAPYSSPTDDGDGQMNVLDTFTTDDGYTVTLYGNMTWASGAPVSVMSGGPLKITFEHDSSAGFSLAGFSLAGIRVSPPCWVSSGDDSDVVPVVKSKKVGSSAAPVTTTAKMLPQSNFDPSNGKIYIDGAWKDPKLVASDVVVKLLNGKIFAPAQVPTRITNWGDFDPQAQKIMFWGSWKPVKEFDEGVWIKMADGSLVSPDRLSLSITNVTGEDAAPVEIADSADSDAVQVAPRKMKTRRKAHKPDESTQITDLLEAIQAIKIPGVDIEVTREDGSDTSAGWWPTFAAGLNLAGAPPASVFATMSDSDLIALATALANGRFPNGAATGPYGWKMDAVNTNAPTIQKWMKMRNLSINTNTLTTAVQPTVTVIPNAPAAPTGGLVLQPGQSKSYTLDNGNTVTLNADSTFHLFNESQQMIAGESLEPVEIEGESVSAGHWPRKSIY